MRQTVYKFLNSFKKFNIPIEYDEVLNQYSEYYQQLNPTLKKVFLYRLHCLLKVLKFHSSVGFSIEPKMKILIASAIVQLTFGLKKFILRHYTKIDVVPTVYTYEGMEDLRIQGDVNIMHKEISVSWEHVEEGFVIPNDAMNLALHEISHSLCFEDNEGSLWGKFLNTEKFKEWEYQSVDEFYKMREGAESFLRSYASVNMYEMFAVSVEAFFEQPLEFKLHLPKMFHKLAELLNQDPNVNDNPILTEQRANHYC